MDFKQTRHKFQGMMSDMGPDTLKAQEYYVDAHNIRLTHNNDNKHFVITNDRFSDLSIDTSGWGDIIGSIEVEKYIIVFDLSGYVRIIDTDTDSLSFLLECDFTNSSHVDAVSYRRNDKQLFVYFVDGVHGLRRLVFDSAIGTDTINIEETNIEITPYLDSSIEVTSIFNSRGGYEAGTVQYYISVIKGNNISAIVYQTPLYYPCYEKRGLPPNEMGGQTFKLEINVPTATKIRLFSVYKAEDDSTYVKYKDISLVDGESTVYDYNDNTWTATDITEILVLNGTAFSAKTVELGDYNLFMGNLGTLNTNQHIGSDYPTPSSVTEFSDGYNSYFAIQTKIIENGVIRNTPENLNDFRSKVKIIPANIPSGNEFYSYDNQLARSSKDIKIFKRRENYIFGYQLQDKYGQWSDVVPIGNNIMLANPSLGYYTYTTDNDAVPPADIRTNYNYVNDGNYYISVPNARVTISDLRDDYVAIRPMVIYPTEQQRNVISQGILTPTTYRYIDSTIRYPSWFYLTETRLDSNIFHNYKNKYALENDFECYAKLNGEVVKDLNNENCFSVNTDILTMNSPDIQNSHNDNALLNMIGFCSVYSISTKTHLEIENPSYSNEWNLAEDLGSSSVEHWICNMNQDNSSSKISFDGEVRFGGVTSSIRNKHTYNGPIKFHYQRLGGHGSPGDQYGEIWSGDYYAKQFLNEVNDGDGTAQAGFTKYYVQNVGYKYVRYIDMKTGFSYYLYPWMRTGSIINDTSNTVDVIKNKIYSENIFSSENKYFNLKINLENTLFKYDCNISTVYNENNNINIDSDITYISNPDVVLPANSNKYKIINTFLNGKVFVNDNYNLKLNSTALPVVWNSGESAYSVSVYDEINALTNVAYSTKDHYVILPSKCLYSEDSDDDTIEKDIIDNNLNSFFDNKDFVYIAELCRENVNTDYSNLNNWCIAGDTVKIPSRSDNVTLFWTEGDTYFQRYDLLKTVPYSTGEKENNIVEILSCFLESHVNGAGRYDTLRGLKDNTMIDENSFKLNENYNQENNLQQFSTFKPEDLELSDFSNWITWSKKDTDMTVDKYGVFDGTQMLKMNSPVTSIVNYNSHLISLNRDNISTIRYNENVQIPTIERGVIRIASDDSVSGYDIANNYIGCQRIETVYDDKSGIYFGDDNTKTLYLYNDKFIPLSDKLLMKSWFESNPNWSTFGDKSHNDVYFTGDEDTLNFNEEINSFVSKFRYNDCKFIHSTENGSYGMFNNGVHKLFSGNYTWYDITFMDNEQPYDFKIFNNIEFRADMFDGEEIKDEVIPFAEIQCSTEFSSGSEELKYDTEKPSNLQKRFRTWRMNIPRVNDSEIRLSDNWMKTTLSSENEGGKQLRFYDLVTNFYY